MQADNDSINIPYAIIAVAALLIYVGMRMTKYFCGSTRAEKVREQSEGYQMPEFGHQPQPPVYSAAEPLSHYSSQHSVDNEYVPYGRGEGTYPRPLV